MTFSLLLLAIVVCGFIAFLLAGRKKKQLADVSWEKLLEQLESVPIEGITRIANDYLHPSRDQLAISTAELWQLIGEEEGLRRMQANAEVLIALAAYAGRWNFEESAIVWERMRRDGLTLRRATRRLTVMLACGRGEALGPFNVQEAASAYWLMRERLLKLYQTSHAGRYPRLISAV